MHEPFKYSSWLHLVTDAFKLSANRTKHDDHVSLSSWKTFVEPYLLNPLSETNEVMMKC